MPTSLEHIQYEIVKGELVVRVIGQSDRIPRDDQSHKFINVASWFSYPDFKEYYGPSNVMHIIKFNGLVLMHRTQHPKKTICIVVRQDCDQFLNALLLVAFYLLIVRDMTPTQIVQHLASLIEAAPKRHYKTEGELMEDDMPITIQHCLEGLQMAMELGLLRLEELDIDEIAMREHPLNGDMNWVVPGRILALAGPTEDTFSIEEFIPYAHANRVVAVVRLNRIHYEAQKLVEQGIDHHGMFIHDGNIPSPAMIIDFCRIAEEALERGALAVHCRAGLGRTGTMIAIYLIHKYGLQAAPVIAYLRMMRPGMILGMQARYLETIQYLLRHEPMPEEVVLRLKAYYPQEFQNLEEIIRRLDQIMTCGSPKKPGISVEK